MPGESTNPEPSPTSQVHLYVMQGSCGRIKIGRSINPEKRRRDLQTQGGRTIRLVAVFQGQGAEERRIHAALAPHRLLGEWFRSSIACRNAIIDLLGPMKFPFEYTADARRKAAEVKAAEKAEADYQAMMAKAREYLSRPTRRVTPFIGSPSIQTMAEYQAVSDARRAAYLAKKAKKANA